MRLSANAIRLVEGVNFAHLATLRKDGSPHVTPVWIDREGDVILVNTAEGRVKWHNVKRDPRVSISIINQKDPYEMLMIHGRVTEITNAGADAHIDKMAKKYLGKDGYPNRRPGERRALLKIQADHIVD
jgi:PPOX class probable F420-dependent enzyme